MSKKKNNFNIKISFVGNNADDITGSMILVETPNYKILLEAGLYQSNNPINDYKVNSQKLKFKPKEIDFIFWNHLHADHTCGTPRLFSSNCHAIIFAPKDSRKIAEILLKDSAYINEKDAYLISKIRNKSVLPIYTMEDVENTLDSLNECDFNKVYKLNDEISFKYIYSGHILRSAQLVLYIKCGNRNYSILYTSDLGNIKFKNKPFVENLQAADETYDLVIGESTYSKITKEKYNIEKDLETIKKAVVETCINRKSELLIPCFSLDRIQMIAKLLYDMFGQDNSFNIPICIDSPMACDITKAYGEILEGKDLDDYNNVFNWRNIKLIKNLDDSIANLNDNKPKIILSSSGMMSAGRVINYAKKLLPNFKATIIFCGYASENSLAYKIKTIDRFKNIMIDRARYKKNCTVIDCHSFSSHMQRDDMLNYYKGLNTNMICLVHGNFNDKCIFSDELKLQCELACKTTKVIAVNKNLVVKL